MDSDTLGQILGDQMPTEPSFLIDKKDKINEEGNIEDIENQKIDNISEGKFHCKYSDGFTTDSLPDLMNHYRATHPEHKGSNRIKKEKALLQEQKEETDVMSDDNDLPDIFENETTDIVETETAKKPKATKKKVESDIAVIPSDYDRLSSLLQSFGVPNWKGVVESMKLYSLTDINMLKDLLRNVSTPQGKSEAVIRLWSELQGLNKPHSSDQIASSISGKQTTPTDALSLMAKLRDEEIQDSIVSSYQEKLKSKKLENEIAMKRLNGELNMDNKNNPDISKIIELEMLKYQMMQQQKTNPELELLKLQMMQPKTNPEVDMLKSELAKLQLQLSSPRTDSQVELLKQQLESQNKKYEDIQRKIEEDNKTRLLSDQHKQEMDLLKQQIAEQSKQTQELMKTIQTASSPKIEDTLKIQITEIQKQSDAKLQTVLDQLRISNESKKEEEYRRTIETLKDEIKNNRDQSLGAVGQVADSMKSFATDITHVIEKRDLKDEYTKREDELKKKISDAEHNRSMTNEQYVMEKTGKIAEEAVKAIGTGLDGFGKALQPATKSAAESSAIMERAALAMDLKSKGFDAQTINNILSQQNKSTLPSARSEYENLAKITTQMEDERNAISSSIQQEQSSTFEQPVQEQTVIKFATSENEK